MSVAYYYNKLIVPNIIGINKRHVKLLKSSSKFFIIPKKRNTLLIKTKNYLKIEYSNINIYHKYIEKPTSSFLFEKRDRFCF